MREIKFRGKRLDNELELMLSAATLRSDGDNLRMDFGTGERGLVRGQDGERDQEFNLSARRGPWSFGLAHVDVERVIHAFPDLEPGTAECPRSCTHDEADCALDDYVTQEGIDPARLASLRRLLASMRDQPPV